MNNKVIEYENVNASIFPDGPETLKKILDFLPNDNAKNELVFGFANFLSVM